MYNLPFEKNVIDNAVIFTQEIPKDSCRVAKSQLICRQQEVETFHHVPDLRY